MKPKKYKLKYVPGWMGGHYEIDGEEFQKRAAVITVKGKEYPVVYREVEGYDYDHGHRYNWQRVDIGIMDGCVIKRFLSVEEMQKNRLTVKLHFVEEETPLALSLPD
jgi:hypothetical protein